MVLGDLGLSDDAFHALAAVLQGVVAVVVTSEFPYPSSDAPEGRVVNLLFLQLRLTCGVAGYGDLHPIWEALA